jgi:hypothetical protein
MNDDLYIDDARKKIKLILDNEIKTKTHGTSCFGVLQCGLENVHSLGYQLTKNFQTLSYGYEPNMRVGAEGCMERGVQVLKVLLNGIEIFRKRYS